MIKRIMKSNTQHKKPQTGEDSGLGDQTSLIFFVFFILHATHMPFTDNQTTDNGDFKNAPKGKGIFVL